MPVGIGRLLSRAAFRAERGPSKNKRFKCAVTLGFFIATAGFMAAGPDARDLFAQDSVWGLSSLFGEPAGQSVQSYIQAGPSFSAQQRTRKRHTSHLAAIKHATQTGRVSYCVRLCDGFAYPVGAYHGESDHASHESLCQSTCPDAATALYVMPSLGDKIGNAVEIATGRNYSDLPDAFHYTTVLDDACACHKAGIEGRTMSLLRDSTLRRGDAIMTTGGFKVFHGARGFPYSRQDFVSLAQSRDVGRNDRAKIGAIERASLKQPVSMQPSNDTLFSLQNPPRPPRARQARLSQQASRQ